MTTRIVLFNGPPRCGKDTAAIHVFNHWGALDSYVVFDRMSMPIKKAFAATVALPIDRWGNVDYWEDHKGDTIPGFGVSYRQWQIDFSEKFMKPLYGTSIFARLFISRAQRQHRDAVILVPDCGFDVEYETLVNQFGAENILVVKIYRPGCTFEGDSRNYLKVGGNFIPDGKDATGQFVMHINNSGTLEDFQTKITTRVGEWLADKSSPQS